MSHLLSIKNLKTHFYLRKGVVRAVDEVSFDVARGETVGIVGESGSGKSVTALSILRIIFPPGKILAGGIWFDGRDLLKASEEEMRQIRGKKIAMIFQNPQTCLNPIMTVGDQIAKICLLHHGGSKKEATSRTSEMLRLVQIADPDRVYSAYPHELSGGMCQRIMIVMALICEPLLIIADEPTTGLDVTIEKQILNLMRQLLLERKGMSRLMISHDMGVVANTCHRIVVMYSGKIMEIGSVKEVYHDPLHPYTKGLIQSIPRIDRDEKPHTIGGELPNPMSPPSGCRFFPRCSEVLAICPHETPSVRDMGSGRLVACHLFKEGHS
jgi:oligopeptide/dipeptide ABC transporter ATP-binding protein